MMLTLSRPLIIFDLETTGPNPDKDRVVSFAFQRFLKSFPGGLERTWKTLINPGVPIPREASFGAGGKYKGHGITDAMVQGCKTCGMERTNPQHLAESPDTAGAHDFQPWPEFRQIAPSVAKGFTGCDFGGFNIRFDLQVTRNEFGLAGIEWDHFGANVIDGFRLWQIAIPRTLADAVEEFCGRKATDAHEAGSDVADSVDVICGILRKFGTLPRDMVKLDSLCFPGKIDAEGKFSFNEAGEPCVNFGQKWKGVPMRRVERDYYAWMLGHKKGTKPTFAPSTKAVALEAFNGRFPKLAGSAPAESEDM